MRTTMVLAGAPLLLALGLVIAGCDFRGDDFRIKACDLIEPGQEAATQKAWGALKRERAMQAFAVNKGVITELELARIIAGGKWPEGARAKVEACFE